MQPVQRIRCRGHGGVAAEGSVGGLQVVVNGLGHPDHRHPLFRGETVGDFQAAVASYGDMAGKTHAGKGLHDPVGNIAKLHLAGQVFHRHGKGVALVGGAEDGAAGGGDVLDDFRGEADKFVRVEQTLVAAVTAVYLPAPVVGGFGYGVNDGVESGGIAAAGGYDDFFHLLGLVQ